MNTTGSPKRRRSGPAEEERASKQFGSPIQNLTDTRPAAHAGGFFVAGANPRLARTGAWCPQPDTPVVHGPVVHGEYPRRNTLLKFVRSVAAVGTRSTSLLRQPR